MRTTNKACAGENHKRRVLVLLAFLGYRPQCPLSHEMPPNPRKTQATKGGVAGVDVSGGGQESASARTTTISPTTKVATTHSPSTISTTETPTTEVVPVTTIEPPGKMAIMISAQIVKKANTFILEHSN